MLNRLFYCLLLSASVWPVSFCALAQPTLKVYTYDAFAGIWGPGPAIKKAFEAECRCKLVFITLADGVSLLNRLRMEGQRSAADVVLGLDNNLLRAAEETGLFAPSDVDIRQLMLSIPWDNKIFIPYDYGYFAFVYHRDKVKNPPASLHELVNGQQPWKIVYQDPRTSTPGLGLLLWMKKIYGDNAPVAWKNLAKKTVTVTKSWNEAYGLFLLGEADLVLSYTTTPAYHYAKEHNSEYAAARFSEGHYLQIEVAGRLASSKEPELAKRFMQFLLTSAFQKNIPDGNWMYPVIDIALPESFSNLIVPQKTLQYSAREVAEKRSQWISEWQAAVSH